MKPVPENFAREQIEQQSKMTDFKTPAVHLF